MDEVDNLDTNIKTMDFKPTVHNRSALPSSDKEKMEVQEKEIKNKVKFLETVMQQFNFINI